MQARIEREIVRDSFKVWLFQPGPGTTVQVIGVAEDGQLLLQNFEEGAAVPPSFILPGAALAALVKEASDVLPASDATVEALKDTREVRDRLLALVEKRH